MKIKIGFIRINKMSLEKNKVYVTGNPEDQNRISRFSDILVKCGYEDTHKWLSDGIDIKKYIENEMKNMENSDLVIVDMNMNDLGICWGWVGCALGMRKEVWIVENKIESIPFLYSSDVIRFKSWDEVFSELHPI